MSEEQNGEQTPKRNRHVPRRHGPTYAMPRRLVPVPIRGLWRAASEEERKKAHETGVAILELWLGQTSRKEIAERLGIPPLRIWQLSQQALAGLTAGLLKQPRSVKVPEEALEDALPARVRKKLQKQEEELESLRRLVGLLREMPAQRQARTLKEGAGAGQKKRTARQDTPRAATKHRSSAPCSMRPTGRADDGGSGTGCNRKDDTQLDQGITGGAKTDGPAAETETGGVADASAGSP